MSRRPKPPARPRTTVPLTGTISKLTALLDADTLLAIDYAQVWQLRHRSLKVPAAGIVRRALQVYVRHLSSAQGADEIPATERACKVLTRPPEELQAALLRLHGSDPAEPLPAFEVIRDGARVVAERRALHQRLESLL